jgi:hypothetical protein
LKDAGSEGEEVDRGRRDSRGFSDQTVGGAQAHQVFLHLCQFGRPRKVLTPSHNHPGTRAPQSPREKSSRFPSHPHSTQSAPWPGLFVRGQPCVRGGWVSSSLSQSAPVCPVNIGGFLGDQALSGPAQVSPAHL